MIIPRDGYSCKEGCDVLGKPPSTFFHKNDSRVFHTTCNSAMLSGAYFRVSVSIRLQSNGPTVIGSRGRNNDTCRGSALKLSCV